MPHRGVETAMHLVLVLYGTKEFAGAVLDSSQNQTDYHRDSPCHYESDKDIPDKVLIGGDSKLVCELTKTFALRSRVHDGEVVIDFDGCIYEVEADGNWTRDEFQEIIVEMIHRLWPSATIDIVTF